MINRWKIPVLLSTSAFFLLLKMCGLLPKTVDQFSDLNPFILLTKAVKSKRKIYHIHFKDFK